MTDHQSFLSSIIANPDDDAPRLIYADWLEEQGESERAEFIRVQCELATIPKFEGVKIVGDYQVDAKDQRVEVSGRAALIDLRRYRPGFRSIRHGGGTATVANINRPKSFPLRFGEYEAKTVVIDYVGDDDRCGYVWTRFTLLPWIDGDQYFHFHKHGDRTEPLEQREIALASSLGMSNTRYLNWIPPWTRSHFGREDRLPEDIETLTFPCSIRRGFVDKIECTWWEWLRNHYRIVENAPITRVEFSDNPEMTIRYQPDSDSFSCEFGNGLDRWLANVRLDNEILTTPRPRLREIQRKALKSRWPGLEFDFPPEPTSQIIPILGGAGNRAGDGGGAITITSGAGGIVIPPF